VDRLLSAAPSAATVRVLAALLAAFAMPLGAQMSHERGAMPADSAPAFRVGAQAIPLVTRASPGPFGIARTEGALTQPLVMAAADPFRGRLFARATFDAEGWTMPRGELDLGAYGEGFVDRRHPHTYLHELVAGARATLAGTALSVAGGKGFVPFGTDDPMARPFVKYPVNHHLSQLLERAFVSAAARRGALLVEGALFGGDEPTSPGSAPLARRFGDSWSTRVTVAPRREIELAASYASVASPEFRTGQGLDQRKWNVSARWSASSRSGALRYALLEWGRTSEGRRGRESFRFGTTLAEATLDARIADLSLRVERTVRPEEERLLDPFRTPRPLADFNIIGETRWDVLGAHLARDLSLGALGVSPFVEGAVLRPRAVVRPTTLDPRELYGRRTLAMLSAGARLAIGHRHARMGRFGAAGSAPDAPHVH
jgi:hypothetical protein